MMKHIRHILRTLVLAIALIAAGQNAWADVVTGQLLGNATDGYYVNMPKDNNNNKPWPVINLQTLLDNQVTSLKVYDDGGKDGNYSNRCDGYIILQAPTGYRLRFSGTLWTENKNSKDDLRVYNGTSTISMLFEAYSTSNGVETAFGPYASSGDEVLVTFYSYQSPAYAGFEMTVELIDVQTEFAITCASATGGTITTLVDDNAATQAKVDQTVTVNATPASGYYLNGVTVGIDGSSNLTVPVTGGDFMGNTGYFTMPLNHVTVTPTFTTDATSLYINMPASGTLNRTIPRGITSFKVYDDGGAEGNYSKNSNGTLTLTAPEGCVLLLTGTIVVDHSAYLYVYDGQSATGTAINSVKTCEKDGVAVDIGNDVVTTGRYMTINFYTGGFFKAGLDLTVSVLDYDTEYNVSTGNPAHGSIDVDKTKAKFRETVTVTPTPESSFSIAEVSYTFGTTKVVVAPENGVYSFSMPNSDITVDAVFEDEVTVLWGGAEADGSAAHPYIISDKAGWDLLIEKSKTADFTNGKYFELAADISGVTKSVYAFGGHLDGKGHKVTLEKDKSSFCYGLIQEIVAASTISNLTVDGTISNNFWAVGGFVQRADFPVTFTNCRSSVAITSYIQDSHNFRGGGFIGITGSQGHVFDRCVFDGSFTSSNTTLGFYPWVGGNYSSTYTNCASIYGGNAGFRNGSTDARAYTLTLTEPATVVRTGSTAIGNGAGTAYTDGFSYGGSEYHIVGSTVTLSAPAGICIAAATYNGQATTINTDGTASFAMPAANTTAAITGFAANYIDAEGAQQTHAVTLIGSSSGLVTLEGGWYAVTGNVTISKGLVFTSATHLILTDGASLSVQESETDVTKHTAIAATDLTIYGQTLGTGTLNANASNSESSIMDNSFSAYGIEASGSVVLCGGRVNATASGMKEGISYGPVLCHGIHSPGNNVTIIRGCLSAIANRENMYTNALLTSVAADGVILDWRQPDDRITLQLEGSVPTVRIADGKAMYNGSEVLSGTLSLNQFNGKTLTPYSTASVNLTLAQGTIDGVTAWWGTYYGNQRYTLPEGAAAYTMDKDHQLFRLGTDGRTIPAEVAVVVICDLAPEIVDGKPRITLTPDSGNSPVADHAPNGGNILRGGPATLTDGKVDGKTPYVLGIVNGVLGFYEYTGGDVPAHKAYYVQ